MIVKVTVSHDLYVEAEDTDQALEAVKDDYGHKKGYSFSAVNDEYDFYSKKVEFSVDRKTKKLISL